MSILVSHPSGNANVRQLALGLVSAGLLGEVATGLALTGEPARWWPAPLRRELARRQWPPQVVPFLRPDPGPEIMRLLLVRQPLLAGTAWPARLANWHYCLHDQRLAHRLAHGPAHRLPRLLYAYEDAAAASFKAARRRGLTTVLELPTLHADSVWRWQAEEAVRHPEWRALLPALNEPAWKRQRKAAELAAADRIVVASTLVRDSCLQAGITQERLLLIPYGAPEAQALKRPERQRPIALYVGRLAPAKGIQHLLAAWRQLDHPGAELWLVGASDYPRAWHAALPSSVRCFGSVPHSELADFQAQAQLFVFPSLLEGFGLAAQEAMAAGLPVLLTERCGIRDLIIPGLNGWIVPAADPAALAAMLSEALVHPHRCRRMGAAAQATVARHTWADYHGCISAALQATVKP
jgi:starch synthase